MRYKVVLWGLGAVYSRHVNALHYFEVKGDIEILGITGNMLPKENKIDGYSLLAKDSLKNIDFDFILLMNERNRDEITEEIFMLGIDTDKIVSYKMLDIPNVNINSYLRIKRQKISIISNNCFAGILCHTLGLECCSPFKNLFLEDEDYIKLLNNLKFYLTDIPVFDRFAVDIHSKARYPVLKLRDIYIHCNHDTEAQAAISKWTERCKKINYENLLVEMYTEEREILNKFLELKQYQKKICFVSFETDDSVAIYLKSEGKKELWERVLDVASAKDVRYDLVKLIETGLIEKRMEK